MNEISCEICMDLMPLVHDGVASGDSRAAVLGHIAGCERCRAAFEGEMPPAEAAKTIVVVQRKARLFVAMVMMFGILYGLMLTAGNGIFYNVLIMPAIGAIGYYLFRWKGLYWIPALLFATHFLTNALGMGEERLQLPTLVLWTAIYCGAALTGFAIAALLHFAFRREDKSK